MGRCNRDSNLLEETNRHLRLYDNGSALINSLTHSTFRCFPHFLPYYEGKTGGVYLHLP